VTSEAVGVGYFYDAYGLRIHAALRLPELRESTIGEEVDAIVTPMEEVPALPTSEAGLIVWPQEDEVVLQWKHFGTYRVRGGRRLEYAPARDVAADAVRVPLLGVCMGLLLHQRGLLTLHASAVAVGDGAVAFVGAKGAGKSTTAAAFLRRGHPLVADDVVAVDLDEGGVPTVSPGLMTVKLWPPSLAAVGVDPHTVPRLHDGVEKRILRADEVPSAGPLPLRALYVLEEGEELALEPVRARDAFVEVVRHTYATRFIGPVVREADLFRRCTRFLQSVPVRRLVRPNDLGGVDALVRLVEAEHVAHGAA
jgi:hypothetical protein